MHPGKSYVEKAEDKSVPRQSRFIRQSRSGNKTKQKISLIVWRPMGQYWMQNEMLG